MSSSRYFTESVRVAELELTFDAAFARVHLQDRGEQFRVKTVIVEDPTPAFLPVGDYGAAAGDRVPRADRSGEVLQR